MLIQKIQKSYETSMQVTNLEKPGVYLMVILKNIFGERGPEFGSMMGFERTENLEFH